MAAAPWKSGAYHSCKRVRYPPVTSGSLDGKPYQRQERLIGESLADAPRVVPNVEIVTVKKLIRFVNRLCIIGAVDHTCRSQKVTSKPTL
jgi:hypothetical protein